MSNIRKSPFVYGQVVDKQTTDSSSVIRFMRYGFDGC